ncbi:hypothetical protein M2168_006301 [Streptomyces sp. CZ24]|nr:hypothetical protein [Streptomyces sp. CZ24]MDH6193183.1 hypothetical protein [Streptomyces sp. CZ24]
MDDLDRPSPKAMALRRPNLQPRSKVQPSRRELTESRPKRHDPVTLAWCDTGTLLSLGRHPDTLDKVRGLYGSSLVVTYAVAREIRAMANIRGAMRTHKNRERCESADTIVEMLNAGSISEHPLRNSEETLEMIDRVLRQLDAFEERQKSTFGRSDDSVRSSQKHAGEAHSIVSAMLTTGYGKSTVLLTNDNGAMRVAEQNNIAWKHTAQLLAELGCEEPSLRPDELLAEFNYMTSSFASVPSEVRPNGPDFFRCRRTGSTCSLCDVKS